MNEEYERWKNEQWRLAVNAIPGWEGAWNMATHFHTSAEIAKIRLHGVVAQDRKACECARWKVVRKGLTFLQNWEKLIDSPIYGDRRLAKEVYRWTVRR